MVVVVVVVLVVVIVVVVVVCCCCVVVFCVCVFYDGVNDDSQCLLSPHFQASVEGET